MPALRSKLTSLVALLCALAAPASAQEQVQLMDLPASYTDVIDAFDGDDVLDVNVRAGFVRSSRSGTIQREVTVPNAGGMGGASTTRRVDVAAHSRVTNSLRLGLDVGIYKDLAVYGELPVVLRDSRELSLAPGRSQANVDADLSNPALDGSGNLAPPDQDPLLFHVPFTSPARSGIPAVHLGIAWSPSNQYRTPNVPTWVLMAEARLATGNVMRACVEDDDMDTTCRGSGISDGTSSMRFESRTSYRFRHVEPYIGFALELPWVSTGEALFGTNLDGLVQRQPPRTGEITVGGALIPWEDRERFQRVAIDLRMSAAYVSEGRDITPLFDALGTSRNVYLTAPNYDRLVPLNDPMPPTAVSMTGVTDVSSHARVGFQAATVIQAAKYIRFVLGFGLGYASPYMLTGADACNPNVKPVPTIPPAPGDPRKGGCGSGILNPTHRPVIDITGQRFILNGEVTFDLYSSATAQF